MKTPKTVTTLIALAMIAAIFSGCSSDNTPSTDTIQANAENTSDTIETTQDPPSNEMVYEDSSIGRFIGIHGDNELISDKIIELVEHCRSLALANERNTLDNIENLAAFYDLRDLTIEGYDLHAIHITKHSLDYRYFPSEIALDKEYRFTGSLPPIIIVSINRHDRVDNPADPMRTIINQATSQGWGHLTEDGMIYSELGGIADITAQLGETWFVLQADGVSDYTYLHSLARQVIDTAELVKVD